MRNSLSLTLVFLRSCSIKHKKLGTATYFHNNSKTAIPVNARNSAHFREIIGNIVRISIEKVDSYLRRNDNREFQSNVQGVGSKNPKI